MLWGVPRTAPGPRPPADLVVHLAKAGPRQGPISACCADMRGKKSANTDVWPLPLLLCSLPLSSCPASVLPALLSCPSSLSSACLRLSAAPLRPPPLSSPHQLLPQLGQQLRSGRQVLRGLRRQRLKRQQWATEEAMEERRRGRRQEGTCVTHTNAGSAEPAAGS